MLRIVVISGILCGLLAPYAGAEPLYRVHAGDTLSGIAGRFGTTVTRLEHLNRLSPSKPLLAGATLELPPPKSHMSAYRIQPGDTLAALAVRFHTTANAIAAASGVELSQPILIGATLRVPTPAHPRPTLPTVYYRARAGDTLSGIALRYGVSLGALVGVNHLDVNSPLLVGARLALPPGAVAHVPVGFSPSLVRESIVRWAGHYGVNPQLVTALAWMESGFNNELVSPAGAIGVMQITPDTWNYVEQVLLLGQVVPHTSDGNVRVGVAYLHHLLHIYDGDEQRALAAYYQGSRSLQQDGFLPGTSQYVDDILALEQRF